MGAASLVSSLSSSDFFLLPKLLLTGSSRWIGAGEELLEELTEVAVEEAGVDISQSRWICGILMTVSTKSSIIPKPSRR